MPLIILDVDSSWGRPLLIFTFTRRCSICGGGRPTERGDLEIYRREARSWRGHRRALCARCRPRLALASIHGGVMNAPNGTLIIDAGIASGPNLAYEATTPRTNALAASIWALAVLVVCAFGVLATFASPLFFLGVVVCFISLAVLAGRSS